MTVISTICHGSYPADLKSKAAQALSSLANVNRPLLAHSTAEILTLASLPGNKDLLTIFLSMPELYQNNQAAVHDKIELFKQQQFQHYASLYHKIAQLNPVIM